MGLLYFPGNTTERRGAGREGPKRRRRSTLWAESLLEPVGRQRRLARHQQDCNSRDI